MNLPTLITISKSVAAKTYKMQKPSPGMKNKQRNTRYRFVCKITFRLSDDSLFVRGSIQ